jgi:hypothetical protein
MPNENAIYSSSAAPVPYYRFGLSSIPCAHLLFALTQQQKENRLPPAAEGSRLRCWLCPFLISAHLF